MKKIILLLLILTSIGFSKTHAQGGWTQTLTFGGSARTFPSCFTIGSDVYIGVGLTNAAPQTASRDFWKFDPTSGTWSQVADFTGNTRWGGYGFAIDGKGYIGCGRDSLAVSYKDHWEYDSSSNSWTQKADFPGGVRRGCTAAAYNGKGYVGLGWNGASYFDDWYEYDPTNDSWTQKTSYGGGAINYPVSFVIGDKIYVGTGYNNTTYNADFYKYDVLTDSWTAINSFAGSGRYGAAAFVIGHYAFVGTGGTQNATGFTDFWRYDTVTGNWDQMPDMPGAVRYCVGFSAGDKGYVACGDSNNAVRNRIWTFDTSSIYTTTSSYWCVGGNIKVDFTTTGTMAQGNLFSLEMSDEYGDFTSPTVIDTLTGTGSGSFNFSLPKGLKPGTGYKVRTVSSASGIIGYPSGTISIAPLPNVNLPGGSPRNICGSGTVNLSADTSSTGVNYESFMIEIIYDATQGQSSLSGASKVYMHSGTADTTLAGTSWNNVIGNWGNDDGVGEMISLGNNLWKITIDVAKYYGVGYGYNAKYLAMVFRNADGTSTGKGNNGDDIFVNIYNGKIIGTSSSAVSAKFLATYQWYDASGAIAGATGSSLQVSNSGDYKLAIGGICSDTSSAVTVNVYTNINAGFTVSSNASCSGSTGITFTDTTSNNANGTRTWNFGDGNTSSAQTITHVYNTVGSYTATLYENYAGGCVDSEQVNITVNPLPSVSFTLSNTVLCKTNNQFDMTNGSSIASGSISSYVWNFGDGNTDNNTNASHSYAAAGQYTITLVATSNNGCVDSTTNSVTVRPSVDQNMYINSVSQCLQGNNFSFIDSSTISSGIINQHDWDFGDGQTSTNTVSPTHSYKNAGTYTVTLINSSTLGCSDTIRRTVNVLNKLNAIITPSTAQSFCQGSSVTLKTSASSNYTYQWVKDGSAISGANTDSLVVNASGNYHIIVDVPGGCGDTSTDVSVTVKPKVTISAINGPTNPGFNTTKSYTVSKQAGVNFNWIVTGGTILNGQGTDSINVQWGNPAGATIKVYAECADTVTLNVNIVGGIQSAKNSIRAEIYPNPTNDILNIDASQFKSNYMIRLIDLSGKTIYTHQQPAGVSTLDLSGLPAGSYIIELSNHDDTYRQMMIKK